jgi:hypothetical protein
MFSDAFIKWMKKFCCIHIPVRQSLCGECKSMVLKISGLSVQWFTKTKFRVYD